MDNDGYITREEMYDIVGAIYEMLGSAKSSRPNADGIQAAPDATSDEAPNVRVDRIFELLDSVSTKHTHIHTTLNSIRYLNIHAPLARLVRRQKGFRQAAS